MHERKSRFTSLSGLEIERVYTPEHLKGWTVEQDLGEAGDFPYTRGIYPTMYRSRLWTMREFPADRIADRYEQTFHLLVAAGRRTGWQRWPSIFRHSWASIG